jgi:hypothetical protein
MNAKASSKLLAVGTIFLYVTALINSSSLPSRLLRTRAFDCLPVAIQKRDAVSVHRLPATELDDFLSSLNPLEDLFFRQERRHQGFSATTKNRGLLFVKSSDLVGFQSGTRTPIRHRQTQLRRYARFLSKGL